MNFRKICVFDTETNDKEPSVCSIVQLAAVVIDPRTLEIIPGSEFNMGLKPDFATNNKETVELHARWQNTTVDAILDKWNSNPLPQVVWPEFARYLKKYHTKQSLQTIHTAPVPAGVNIIEFDLPIIRRYDSEFGQGKPMFHGRDKIDLMDWFFPWFENNNDVTAYNMNYMREYFGIDKAGAHDALKDVQDTAAIIIRFMNLYRKTAKKVNFKNAFAKTT